MKGTGKQRKLTRALSALCVTMVVVLLLSSAGATLAKYISESRASGPAAPAPFYFTSDTLKEDGAYYKVEQISEGGTAELSFTLSNFVDSLRCTEETISYTCWAVAGNDPNADPIDTKPSASLSGKDSTTAPIVFTVKAEDFESEGVITLFARSQSPYAKTLSATFGFTEEQAGLQWKVDSGSGAVVLELAGGSGQDVTVRWPASLMPDRSNSILQDAVGSEVTFPAADGVRYALTFLKADTTMLYDVVASGNEAELIPAA